LEDPPLHQEDQPPEELELKVVVDIGEFRECGLLAFLKTRDFGAVLALGRSFNHHSFQSPPPNGGYLKD